MCSTQMNPSPQCTVRHRWALPQCQPLGRHQGILVNKTSGQLEQDGGLGRLVLKLLCSQIHSPPSLCSILFHRGVDASGLLVSWVWPVGGTVRGLEGRRKGEDRLFLCLSLFSDSSCISSMAPAPSGEPPAVALVPSEDPHCPGSDATTLFFCPS